MKKLTYLLLLVIPAWAFLSCSNTISYAEMKKNERNNISRFIDSAGIKVISESQFYAQDSMTDVSKNEYVLFSQSGIYMQIVNKGEGIKLKDGDTRKVLCRFLERRVSNGDTITTNMFSTSIVDVMMVTNNSGSYSAYFTTGYMMQNYNSTAVPGGWICPFPFIRLNRELDNLAKVKVIVPHSQGHGDAVQSVSPFYYEIDYQLGR